jgi:hypothetical protein
MKRLAILGVVLGVFATPVYAQTHGRTEAPVAFNGLIFDPPSGHYVAATSQRQGYVAPRASDSKPSASQAPRGFNGLTFD